MEEKKLNNNQEKNICTVVKCFLQNPKLSNKEIASITGISVSSVQRALNNPKILDLFGLETLERINELLEQRTIDARKKGGFNSFQNNEPIKDEKGKFIGVKPTTISNRLGKKCQDILIFANIFLRNPNLSLQQIADFYNENMAESDKVTRDYVYDCLSSKDSYHLLADNLYEVISTQLAKRRINGHIEDTNITNNKRK